MKLIKNDTLWNDPFADLDFMLNRAFASPYSWLRGNADERQGVRVNAYHDDENYYILAELPGVAKEDIKIQLENSVLTIEAQRTSHSDNDTCSYRFSRSVTVGDDVAADKVVAKLENGLLAVTLPKAEERKARPIAIG